jgi:arginine/lysine/ornithine decarboxylase
MGADVVVQSAHKMLPAMTMGAYLHIQSEKINRERVHFYLQALQSSSPSYPIMASLDYARSYLALYKEKDHAYSMNVKKRIVQLLKSKGFYCILVDDPYKLLVRADGLTGYDIQELFESVGVYVELADPYQALLIFPLLKAEQTLFEDKAFKKLVDLQVKEKRMNVSFPKDIQSDRVSALSLPYNEHSCYEKITVSLQEAEGEVSAEMIIPYPPGIPLIMEGEQISSGHIQLIQWLIEHGSRFHGGSGLNEKKIVIFRKEN